MSNEISTTQKKVTTIRDLLAKSKDQIAMALPKHMSPDRMLRIAMTTIQRNPKLLDAEPKSLIGAIMQSAQLGLEIDDIRGQAYLVPFFNKKKGITEVQFIPGYKGLMDLAYRSNKVGSIYAAVVYEKEQYTYSLGLERTLKHDPLPPSQRGSKMIAVYAVGKIKDAEPAWVWLWEEDVQKARNSSKAGNSDYSPWKTDPESMWLKTAIRRLAKYIPQSPELQEAASLDEANDIGMKTDVMDDITTIDVASERVADKTAAKTEELKAKIAEKTESTKPVSTTEETKPISTIKETVLSELKNKGLIEEVSVKIRFGDGFNKVTDLSDAQAYAWLDQGINSMSINSMTEGNK